MSETQTSNAVELARFGAGDQVKVVRNLDHGSFDFLIGQVGTVTDVYPSFIAVALQSPEGETRDYICSPKELELVQPAK